MIDGVTIFLYTNISVLVYISHLKGNSDMTKAKKSEKAGKGTEERTTLTVTLTQREKKALKLYAVERDTTVTALIHDWIKSICKGV